MEPAAAAIVPREVPPLHHRAENLLATVLLGLMAVLPLIEMVTRRLRHEGIPGTPLLVQHLTLCVAFVGAAVAAREDRLLALSTGTFLPERARTVVKALTAAVAGAVCVLFMMASVDLIKAEREAGELVALGIPVWAVVVVMPVFTALVGVRLVMHGGASWKVRALVALPAVLALVGWFVTGDAAPDWLRAVPVITVGAVILVVATGLGLPMFTALAGLALLFFFKDATPLASVPVETYRLTASPLFPAIPLFTLGGYLLSAGGASARLVGVFQAWFGWLPGGAAVVTTLAFAFFTSFTGASGVTILSMGGLLMPVLLRTHFPERFSLGLLTTSGSIGLLFPPSLPVILYGVSAQVPMDKLFVGGLVPGLLLVGAVAAYGVVTGVRIKEERPRFNGGQALRAAWVAKWELLLPVVVLAGIFGGFATLVEAAAITVAYGLVVELVIHRDATFRNNAPRALVECATLVGGVLLILGVAMGFTNYMLDAQIPMRGLAWIQQHVESRWVFLLILNLLLIVVGAAMDIYSAILVVVPLITPMGAAFGIDPVHLGIIFLANLELGYLVPPMGENLFLSSYRFNRPITEVFRATAPFVLIILAVVLLITYVPAMTLTLVGWWETRG